RLTTQAPPPSDPTGGLASRPAPAVICAVPGRRDAPPRQRAGPSARAAPVLRAAPVAVLCWVVAAAPILGRVPRRDLCAALLAAVREQPEPLSLLFPGGDRFLTMFGAMFLTGLAVGIGTLLLVVPGVIAYLGLWLGKFYVVDRQQGAVESLQSSWRDTDGTRSELFVFAFAYTGLVLAGLCMCGIGMLATLPIAEAALTVIYLRRTGQMTPSRPAYAP